LPFCKVAMSSASVLSGKATSEPRGELILARMCRSIETEVNRRYVVQGFLCSEKFDPHELIKLEIIRRSRAVLTVSCTL
jgi:hypothetical protein